MRSMCARRCGSCAPCWRRWSRRNAAASSTLAAHGRRGLPCSTRMAAASTIVLEGSVAKPEARCRAGCGGKGGRVNDIAPGAVDTPMHADHRASLFEYEKYIPLGRMQLAEELAGAAIFLASDASGYITGQTLHVNGGLIMND